ncbi:hypothetical protein [Carboxylicivirga caseinilyticus]|uniref:hypothetical protein n=1 Tax=Carboxylicivirga caseinilyticus TaxID=3417572 RepID=UPI003D350314|nr:hypothetical protein [Marinilabiliaceae bacterium A049]
MKETLLILSAFIAFNAFAQTQSQKLSPQIVNATKLAEGVVENVNQRVNELSQSMGNFMNEMTFFIELDSKIIIPLTSIKNHKKVEDNILESLKNGPILLIDSITYYPIDKDSLCIRISSQNEKFASHNTYRICINEKEKKDASLNYKMQINVDKRNENLENEEGDSFDYSIVKKENKDDLNYNAIEIIKTYR